MFIHYLVKPLRHREYRAKTCDSSVRVPVCKGVANSFHFAFCLCDIIHNASSPAVLSNISNLYDIFHSIASLWRKFENMIRFQPRSVNTFAIIIPAINLMIICVGSHPYHRSFALWANWSFIIFNFSKFHRLHLSNMFRHVVPCQTLNP